MRIDVVGRKLDITEAIREHAESKVDKLVKHFDGVQQVTFTLDHEEKNHDAPFTVELLIDVVHHDDFVCHAGGTDVYGAIDQSVQKGVRQLQAFKEKLREKKA